MKKTFLLSLIVLTVHGTQYAQDQNDAQLVPSNRQVQPYIFGRSLINVMKNSPYNIVTGAKKISKDMQDSWNDIKPAPVCELSSKSECFSREVLLIPVFFSGVIAGCAGHFTCGEKWKSSRRHTIVRSTALGGALGLYGIGFSLYNSQNKLEPTTKRAAEEAIALGHIAMLARQSNVSCIQGPSLVDFVVTRRVYRNWSTIFFALLAGNSIMHAWLIK
ncbi:MAG: hypothetical protein WCE21_01615 [Candidatus Babeliales bacterium]